MLKESDKENMDVVTLLTNLININSINPFKTIDYNGKTIGIGNEFEIANYCANILKENGYSITKQIVQEKCQVVVDDKIVEIPERFNVLAEKGKGNSSLLFLSHLDTVDIKNDWETNPLKATIKNVDGVNRLYGLGSYDMKAGLAAILSASSAICPENYKLKIALVVDEEYLSYGTVKLIETDFLKDVKMAIVPEVMDIIKKTNEQPIILGRMGRRECIFNIKGVSCHGAQSRINLKAINAVHESLKLQCKILKYCEECETTFSHDKIEIKNSAYISYHSGGKVMLSVPEFAEFVLDRSFVMNEDPQKELLNLKEIINESYIDGTLNKNTLVTLEERSRPTSNCDPYYLDPTSKEVRYITDIVDEIFDNHEYGIGFSVADENRLASLNIPVISLGPKGDGCHSSEEYVEVDNVKKLEKAYKKIIQEFDIFISK